MKEKKSNILFIIIFIFYILFFQNFKEYFSPITDNFWKMINYDNSYLNNKYLNIKTIFLNKNDLLKRNEYLENEIQNKNLEILNLKALLNSSSSIINNTDFSDTEKYILAKSIFNSYINTDLYENILLNKGFLSGVNVNDEVYIYPNFFVGKISRIEKDTSLLSFKNKDSEILEGILYLNSTSSESNISNNINILEIKLLYIGGGDYIFELPKDLNISISSQVFLKNDNTKIIGEIIKIEEIPNSFYKKFFVRGYYNPAINQIFFIKIKNK